METGSAVQPCKDFSSLHGAMTIETLLREVRVLLRSFCPVNVVALYCVFPERAVVELSAVADQHGCRRDGQSIGATAEILRSLQTLGAPMQLASRASLAPVAGPLVKRKIIGADVSLIAVRLAVEATVIGLLLVAAEPGREFTPEHARMVKTLRSSLIIGLRHGLHEDQLQRQVQRLGADLDYLGRAQFNRDGLEVVGADCGLRMVMNEVRKAAIADIPVVLTGEPGVGKTLLARTIHYLSRRQVRPYLDVNCRRIPPEQHIAYLFGSNEFPLPGGHLAGSGLFARADGGTVAFRGIEQLSGGAAQLIRDGISDGLLRRCGPTLQEQCEVRLLVLADGWERLSPEWQAPPAITIQVPPLRERRGDIPRLIHFFLERASREVNRLPVPVIDRDSLDRCLIYRWPGNIRELRSIIERAVLVSSDDTVHLAELTADAECAGRWTEKRNDENFCLDQLVADHIKRVLHHTGGKVGGVDGAAVLLGINPSTLRKRMRKLHIPFGRTAEY